MAAKMAVREVPTSGSGGGETSVPGIRESRIVRQAVQRNAQEQVAGVEQQRHLDQQKRAAHAQLAREEKDLRSQLRRLQDEQRVLAEEDAELGCYDDTRSTADEEEARSRESSPEFVNPYPIIFPNSARSTPTPRHSARGTRRGTTNVTSENNPITCRSTHALPCLRSSISHPHPHTATLASSPGGPTPAASKSTPSPGVEPKRTESLGSDGVTSGPWVGEPEAISSIRRARKSVAQQRMQHKWTRSHSLKDSCRNDTGQVREIIVNKRPSIARSKSVRETADERAKYQGQSQGQSQNQGQGQRLAGPEDSRRSIDSLGDAISNMEISSRSPSARLYRSTRMRSQQEAQQASLWGFLADPLKAAAPQSGSPPPQKRKRQKKLSVCNPDLKVSIPMSDIKMQCSPPLPPITSPMSSGMLPQGVLLLTPPPSPSAVTMATCDDAAAKSIKSFMSLSTVEEQND